MNWITKTETGAKTAPRVPKLGYKGRCLGDTRYVAGASVVYEGGGGLVGNSASSLKKTQIEHIYSKLIR